MGDQTQIREGQASFFFTHLTSSQRELGQSEKWGRVHPLPKPPLVGIVQLTAYKPSERDFNEWHTC